MKYLAIIQARCGSSRLPGKVLKDIAGKTALEQMLDRVSKSKYVDEVTVATTFHREDLPIVQLVSGLGYRVFVGSSDDVLDRLHKGLADLAVIAAPYDTEHLEGFPVGREPWAAMLQPDHPLARAEGDSIPLSSLVGEPLIVPSRKSRIEAIRRWFGEIGAEPRILCEMSNYMDAAALTSLGVGISIFPQTIGVSNGLVVSKVVIQPSRQVEYILVWNRGQPPSGLTREFIHFVQENLRNDGSR